jgi:transposase InsO family protein
MLLDTAASTNLVSQRYALSMGWKPNPNLPLPATVSWGNGFSAHLYGAYEILWKATDSWGRTQEQRTVFYGAELAGHPLLLGMPGMQEQHLVVHTGDRTWRYHIKAQEMQIVSANRFAKLVREEFNKGNPQVFALVCLHPTLDGPEQAGRIRIAAVTQQEFEDGATPGYVLPLELQDLRDVFEDPEKPRPVLDVEHEIDTSSDPPFGPIYNLSTRELAALRAYLDIALEKGWIRHSISPAGAPILFVPKKDGGLRLCVDYRALNKVTRKNRLALPLITEILDRLTGAVYLSKVDLKDAYYRIPVAEKDRWKTAFRTRYGHFEYMVMPMGLTNAPATFQAYINRALSGLVDSICVVYLDDILIYSDSRESHLRHVREVLVRLRRFGLYANPKKCSFFASEVDFLGFIVGRDGIRMDPKRVETIANWPRPESIHDVQVFLGFVNFYRRFIEGYSHIARPLTDLLKGSKGMTTNATQRGSKGMTDSCPLTDLHEQSSRGMASSDGVSGHSADHAGSTTAERPLTDMLGHNGKMTDVPNISNRAKVTHRQWQWNTAAEKAFTWLKKAFCCTTILAHFDPCKRIRVETDASKYAIAAILSQLQEDGQWRPVAFWSRKLIPAETRYETHDRELLAIVAAFKQWRHYLEGSTHTVEVLTDHNNLVAFQKVKSLNGRQARWAIALSGYDFTIIHRPGKKNPADAPSRRPDYAPSLQEINKQASMLLPTLQKKLARVEPSFHSEHASEWIQAAAQDLRRRHAFIAEPRENEKPSQLAAQYFGDYVEPQPLADEEDNPFSDSETDRDNELLASTTQYQQDKDAISAVSRQYLPRAVVRIHTASIDNVRGEEDLKDKPFRDLIAKLQKDDPFVARKRSAYDVRATRKRNQELQGQWHFRDDGLLYHLHRLYVPDNEAVRSELFACFHEDSLAGHFGERRTLELVQRHYHWPNIEDYISRKVSTCAKCQFANARRHRPYGELQPLPAPEGPWQELTMDFITDLPPSKTRGGVWDAILVIVDRYSKMALYIPAEKSWKAEDLADAFITRVISRFGTPKGIVTDRGSLFISKMWGEICAAIKLRRRLSTAFHPQTDGQTERQNQTLETYLRIFANDEQDNWASLLPLAEFAYNNSVHSATNLTPFSVVYKDWQPRVSWEHPGLDEAIKADKSKKIRGLQERLERFRHACSTITKRLNEAMQVQKKYYDARHQPIGFNAGDFVLLSTKNLKLKRPKKSLWPKYIGPFEVLEPCGKLAYRLDLPATWRIHDVINISRLEKWRGDDHPYQGPVIVPDNVEFETEQEYEVECILEHEEDQDGVLHYRVKWVGFDKPEDITWEPAEHLRSARATVNAYWRKQGTTPTAQGQESTRKQHRKRGAGKRQEK